MNLNVQKEYAYYVQSFYCYNFIPKILCNLIGKSSGFNRYTIYRHFFCCVVGIISIAAVSLLAQRTM